MDGSGTLQVDIVPEVVGDAEPGAAGALLQTARDIRGELVRAGVRAAVEGDVARASDRPAAHHLVLILRSGRHEGAPKSPAVLCGYVPREPSRTVAQAVAEALRTSTGLPWPIVRLWGPLSVARSGSGSSPAPSVAILLSEGAPPTLDAAAVARAVLSAMPSRDAGDEATSADARAETAPAISAEQGTTVRPSDPVAPAPPAVEPPVVADRSAQSLREDAAPAADDTSTKQEARPAADPSAPVEWRNGVPVYRVRPTVAGVEVRNVQVVSPKPGER